MRILGASVAVLILTGCVGRAQSNSSRVIPVGAVQVSLDRRLRSAMVNKSTLGIWHPELPGGMVYVSRATPALLKGDVGEVRHRTFLSYAAAITKKLPEYKLIAPSALFKPDDLIFQATSWRRKRDRAMISLYVTNVGDQW